ncbi:MAG: restriction endonuclease subunit S [Flavobacteriales bacterium]|nr:MAG: restriction endonuclease subunit S [Flavobacteriales bacterium]
MKKIRFLFRFQSGGTPSTTNEAYWEGTLPWVSAKDMKKMWISDTEDHISEHALTESAANTVPPNSLLLLTRSGILQHTIPVCVNSRRMAINQDVKGCIPVADNVDVRFCAYFIHGSQEQLLPLWRQEGATVESLEFETVKNTAFALPPPRTTRHRGLSGRAHGAHRWAYGAQAAAGAIA